MIEFGDYNYPTQIKTPDDLGMGTKGTMKQLRYNDALTFFTGLLGYESMSVGGSGVGNKLVAGYGSKFLSTDQQLSYLTDYTNEMQTAQDVLNYLTKIYNAVTRFIESQHVLWTKYNTVAWPGVSEVTREQDPYYGTDINPLRELLPYPNIGFSKFGNSDLAKPYYENTADLRDVFKSAGLQSDWYTKSSSTSLLMQLLNFCAAGVLYDTPITSKKDRGYSPGSPSKNYLLGLQNFIPIIGDGPSASGKSMFKRPGYRIQTLSFEYDGETYYLEEEDTRGKSQNIEFR